LALQLGSCAKEPNLPSGKYIIMKNRFSIIFLSFCSQKKMICENDMIHIFGTVNTKKFELLIVRHDLKDIRNLLKKYDLAALHDLNLIIPYRPMMGPGRNFKHFTEKRRSVLLLLVERELEHPQATSTKNF